MPKLTKEAKQTLIIQASLGAVDVLKTVNMDDQVRRAIKRMEIALAANGYLYKEGERKSLHLPVYDYVVYYGGGAGPNVWDDNMEVKGVHNIAEAYVAAMVEIDPLNGWITMIEQKD